MSTQCALRPLRIHKLTMRGYSLFRRHAGAAAAQHAAGPFYELHKDLLVLSLLVLSLLFLFRTVLISSHDFTRCARAALEHGAPILCDARRISEGVTRTRLPAGNEVICTLQDEAVRDLAAQMQNTRSAAALELWRPHLAGAIVAIGNAPTALFHLLNMLEDPACPRPAAIIGCPVGFVGAIESKVALWQDQPVPCCTVHGRLGGSAITVAAINAVASRKE